MNNIITKIYFDLDGVLADFEGGVRTLCGMTPQPQGKAKPEYEDKLWAAAKAVGHFYDKLDVLSDGKKLFDTIYAEMPDKCEILTGIPRPSRNIITATEDKINWVRRNLSKTIPIHTVMRRDKPLYCTGKSCILIDDFDENVNLWNNAGGIGILFTNAEEVLKKIKNILL